MLGSIGIKNGTILYHIGYGTILGCHATSGVISCDQPTCWLIGIGLVTELGCIEACYTSTPTWVIGVFGTTSCREVWSYSLINFFNLSSTKG